jgi:hypothetical protein
MGVDLPSVLWFFYGDLCAVGSASSSGAANAHVADNATFDSAAANSDSFAEHLRQSSSGPADSNTSRAEDQWILCRSSIDSAHQRNPTGDAWSVTCTSVCGALESRARA